jgi:predicted  nucleic acid-binding Zn-ribbon protein
MVPEISHRCPSCGVSIRDAGERVMFCPECGKALAETDDEKSERPAGQTATPGEPAEGVAPPQVNWPPQNDEAKIASDNDRNKKVASEDRHGARERTRETLQRASKATRGAIEDNVKRVEKIHHVSSVMLEEATYDPSLRFVLVALGLFVLFVVLLVLSKVMG